MIIVGNVCFQNLASQNMMQLFYTVTQIYICSRDPVRHGTLWVMDFERDGIVGLQLEIQLETTRLFDYLFNGRSSAYSTEVTVIESCYNVMLKLLIL